MFANIHKGYAFTFQCSDRNSNHDGQPIKT